MSKQLTWIPAILIMVMIYTFSSKPANISGQSSMQLVDSIYSVYENITGQTKVEEDRLSTLETLERIVRKGAHVLEYTLLSLSLAWPLWLRGLRGARLGLFSIGISVIYAATDEFHQTFVPGRSGEIRDVLIDSLGALIGFLIFILIIKIYNTRIRKQISLS